MVVIVAGTLLILTLALVIVFMVALPNIVEGQRVLTPEGAAVTRAAKRRAAKAARKAALVTARQAEATRQSVVTYRVGSVKPASSEPASELTVTGEQAHLAPGDLQSLTQPQPAPLAEASQPVQPQSAQPQSTQPQSTQPQAAQPQAAQPRPQAASAAPARPVDQTRIIDLREFDHLGAQSRGVTPGLEHGSSNVPEQKKSHDSAQPEVSETIAR